MQRGALDRSDGGWFADGALRRKTGSPRMAAWLSFGAMVAFSMRVLVPFSACGALLACSSDNSGFTPDAAPDVPVAVSDDDAADNEDAGIYPYYDAATAIAALANDLWLSCPTYTCAGDVPVVGGVVTVTCVMSGDAGGHCTFDCSQMYAEQACVEANGICMGGQCQPVNGTSPEDAGAPPPSTDAGDAAGGG